MLTDADTENEDEGGAEDNLNVKNSEKLGELRFLKINQIFSQLKIFSIILVLNGNNDCHPKISIYRCKQ